MAIQQLVPINFNKLEALNFRFQNLATPPASPALGQAYIDTDDNTVYVWNGSSWQSIGAMTAAAILAALQTVDGSGSGLDADLLDGQSIAYFATAAALSAAIAAAVNDGDAAGGVLSGTFPNPGFAQDMATQAELDAHLNDTVDAHDASAISFVPASGISATDVQAALVEIVADLQSYADGVAQGLSTKDSVRALSTTNLALATAVKNGDTVGGVVVATGDRVALVGQTAGAENGIYVVNAAGAPTRAADFDANAEVQKGLYFFVEEGTNADSGWVLTTDGVVTLGTTALAFTQFSGAGQITAGAALTKSGNTLDVAVDGASIEINADALRIKAGGVTDAMLASTFTKKYTATVGNGALTSIPVTHNLNTRAVIVEVYDSATYETVLCDVVRTSTTVVTLSFAVAPAAAAYTVVVIG